MTPVVTRAVTAARSALRLPAAPHRPDPGAQPGRRLLLGLVAATAVVGVVAAVALGVVLAFSAVTATVLVAAYVWLGRYHPQPRRYLVTAFVWGAVVSVGLAAALQVTVLLVLDPDVRLLAAVVAPLTEEPAKIAFLLLTFTRARRVVDGFVPAIVYAGIVGLGFAFMENVRYLAVAWTDGSTGMFGLLPDGDGLLGVTTTAFDRAVVTPWLHPLCTSVFAAALAASLLVRPGWRRAALLVLGLVGSMVLHGSWNGTASYAGRSGAVIAYVGLVAVLAVFVGAALRARHREAARNHAGQSTRRRASAAPSR